MLKTLTTTFGRPGHQKTRTIKVGDYVNYEIAGREGQIEVSSIEKDGAKYVLVGEDEGRVRRVDLSQTVWED